MRKTTIIATGMLVAAGIALASAAPARASAGDSFDRRSLGSSWVVTSAPLSISAGQLVGSNLSLGYMRNAANFNDATAVVFLNGTGLQYGAVAVGNIGGGSNAFVKIQEQNGAGTFDHAAFYTGNNGSGAFFTLDTPATSPATLDVTFCGTVAYMTITAGNGRQIYSYDYGTTYGGGGGLGTYGTTSLDNFVSFNGNCNSVPVSHRIPAMRSMEHDLSK